MTVLDRPTAAPIPSSVTPSVVTPQEYLERERDAEYKSEYINGEIVPMSGASEVHNTIVLNIGSELRNAVKNRQGVPCRIYVSDMRVRVPDTNQYRYPDVVAVCEADGPQLEDAHVDTLLNPTVLFEVLSPSTEAYDRGAKFRSYRSIASLREYVMVDQDIPHVEVHERQADGRWLLTQDIEGIDASVTFASLGVSLPLADIYEWVTFPAASVAPAAPQP